MKKIMLIVMFSSALVFNAACSNGEGKKEVSTDSSKIEQLESRVKDLETSDTSVKTSQQSIRDFKMPIEDPTLLKIASAFVDNKLSLFSENQVGPYIFSEESLTQQGYERGVKMMSFYSKDTGEDRPVLVVATFPDAETLEKHLNEEVVFVNHSINATMYPLGLYDSVASEPYKEVFESIK